MGNLRVPCAEEVLVQKLRALFNAAQERMGPAQGEDALTFEAFAEALDENDGRVKRLMRTFVTEARRNRQRTQPYPLQRQAALPPLPDMPSPHRAVARLRLQYLQRRHAQWLDTTNLPLLETSSDSSEEEDRLWPLPLPALRDEENVGSSEGEGEDGPRHMAAYVPRPERPADF